MRYDTFCKEVEVSMTHFHTALVSSFIVSKQTGLFIEYPILFEFELIRDKLSVRVAMNVRYRSKKKIVRHQWRKMLLLLVTGSLWKMFNLITLKFIRISQSNGNMFANIIRYLPSY